MKYECCARHEYVCVWTSVCAKGMSVSKFVISYCQHVCGCGVSVHECVCAKGVSAMRGMSTCMCVDECVCERYECECVRNQLLLARGCGVSVHECCGVSVHECVRMRKV